MNTDYATDIFEGIIFTLKKRRQHFMESQNEDSDFVLFGYYDGLSIAYIDKWYQFRPMGIAKHCGYVKLGDPFVDIYTIKGFFPNEKDAAFDYEIWKEIGKKSKDDDMDAIKNNPYICISSIHLSQDFIKTSLGLDEMTNKIQQYIKTISENNHWDLKEIHCAVFPIIGYSDYVVAFLTDDFEIPTRFISLLREQMTNENHAVVSDCYTLCGAYSQYKITKENYNINSNVRLSAEFSLREGVSAKEFHTYFKKILIDKLEILQIDKKHIDAVKKEMDDYYITFGNTDTLIEPNVNIENYLCVMMSEDFQSGKLSYSNYITRTKTSIRVHKKIGSDSVIDPPVRDLNLPGLNENWKCFSENFEVKLKDKHYAVRTSRAIEQIIQNYYNIANTLHGFDIRGCLNDFIDATIEDIAICWENKDADWDEIRIAINAFRERVGDFIADLLRSDRPYIEGNTLSHPAIGSATKILFAYTSILNETRKLLGYKKHEIVFLVTSGGADATTAIDLFGFMNRKYINDNNPIRKPVLIIVPEKGLYDIKGTLFRMMHECLHYCGNRQRIQRYKLFLDIMSEVMANDIVRPVFHEKCAEEYLVCEKMYITQEKYDRLLHEVKELIKIQYKKATDAIKNCICQYKDFSEYINNNKKEEYYYESVLFHPYSKEENCSGILSEEHLAEILYRKEDSLLEEIRNILQDKERELYAEINEILKKNETNTYGGKMRLQRLEYLNKKNEDIRYKTYLNVYRDCILDNYGRSEYSEMNYWYNYDAISKFGFRAMKEGRSDYLAIRLLDMKVEDYLLAFIYEEKNLDRAVPLTFENALRMGSVLKVGFGISKCDLEKKVLPKIKSAAKNIKDYAGYEYEYENKNEKTEDYLAKYIHRIEQLLEEYENESWSVVTKDLELYLSYFSTDDINEDLSELREIYKKCDMTDKTDSYDTIKYLFKKWEQLAIAKEKK